MKKIKIVFIHHQLVCGGAEQALYDLVNLLDKNVFEITILTQARGGEWFQKFRDTGVTVMDPWTIQRESKNPFRLLVNKIIGVFIERAFAHEGHSLVPSCTLKKFDIVVSYSIWEYQKCGFVSGAKSVKYIHGDIATNKNYGDSIMDHLDLMRKFDRVICVSEGAKDSFCRRTGISDNVVTCYNPLDGARVCRMAQEPVDFCPKYRVLCAVGRLSEEKGFARLIQIHRQLLDAGVKQELVIVGDGPERKNLEALICRLHVENTVHLAGYTLNPYPYMKMSDLLVCSSFTEGLPVVTMEALSLGIPVISALPTIGEAFGDQNCGMITENDDKSLYEGLYSLLTDNARYAQIKKGAMERSKFFTGRNMVQRIEEEFRNLVEK